MQKLDPPNQLPAEVHRPWEMLRRKPTRIELKPEDREEHFAQKATQQQPPPTDSKEKPSEKDVRIGLVKPR